MTLSISFDRLKKAGIACGFLFAFVPLGKPAVAEPSDYQAEALNCASIYYQEPFTDRVAAPAGCPPTRYQQQQRQEAAVETLEAGTVELESPAETLESSDVNAAGLSEAARITRLRSLQSSILPRIESEPAITGTESGAVLPLPEASSEAIAVASPVANALEISITNTTGAVVTYQVVGDTAIRELPVDESAVLRGISLPTTISLVREDGGLLDIQSESAESGMLSLSLAASGTLSSTQGVIRIQEDGQVFLN